MLCKSLSLFVLCTFQIECSSISDYSEKIIKANHLDNGKAHPQVFPNGEIGLAFSGSDSIGGHWR